MAIDDNSVFSHGSRWLRADFHLHTRADKEFSYSDNDDYYFSNYVDALEKADIAVGIIANHNKFDFDEFKALRKTANKKQVFLLPGVELSVSDGANGIHTLIVFSDQWLESGQDYINQFLGVIFEGKTPGQYENENGRSSFGLIKTIEKLEGYHRDFFLIFAHVEDRSGLWHELDGGRLQEMSKDEFFIRRTLAFQKVRTHDVSDRKCRVKVQGWLGNVYPAEVEGSDCKAIGQIGQGKPCYLKIGDFTFEAVKYALLDHVNRIADKLEKHKHSHILSVSFDGGVLDGKTIHLSPELNTLIGIRGSGKSSILETVRYAFDIPFGEKALDTDYKMHLVDYVLGSGGKITVRAVDRRGQHYEIRRINREMPDVYIDGVLQPGISIRETILHKPIYFGQKDLSATGEGFEKDLGEKLVGEKLAGICSRIDAQRQKVSELVGQLKKLSNTEEKKKEADLEDFINQHEDDLKNQRVYTSKQNGDFFEGFFALYDKLIASFGQIKKALSDGSQVLTELTEKAGEFEKLKEGLKEEFAEIERRLSR